MAVKAYYKLYQRGSEYRIVYRPWFWHWYLWTGSSTYDNLDRALEYLERWRAANARDVQGWKPAEVELDEGI